MKPNELTQAILPHANHVHTLRRRCFLVTVGTSLIGQYRKKNAQAKFDVDTIESLGGSSHHECMSKISYRNAYTGILNALHGADLRTFRQYSAELSSLYHIEPTPAAISGDIVALIATHTTSGYLCANLLKVALCEAQPLSHKFVADNINIYHPEYLGKANDPNFATQGLPKFMALLSKLIQTYDNDYDVILIPTGGYKSLIPYATLAGILHKKEVKYIYEDSEVLMTLPQLPVGLDIERWKPAYVLLQALRTLPKSETETYFNRLDPSFRHLLEPPKLDSGRYEYSAIGAFLADRYLALRYQTPLQHQTRGTNLLQCLTRESEKPDLRKYFLDVVKIGPYLWMGDKIPEMMDHALHHHTNLFEIVELILLQIFEHDKAFLSPEEIFILLCTIYFHDIGHVMSRFPQGGALLPTQIRDFHHILGYERLKDRDWQNTLVKLGLTWTGDDTSSLWNNYLELIATIGMFHRRKMPLQRNGEYFCPLNGQKYPPLSDHEKWRFHFEEAAFPNNRAVFIAALFRIIDGLDNQVARTGTWHELQVKAAVVSADAKAERLRTDEINEMLDRYLESRSAFSLKVNIVQLVNRITSAYKEAEVTGCRVDTPGDREELDIEAEIANILGEKLSKPEIPFAQRLVWLYLDAECRTFFRQEQPRHYLKHLAFDSPTISYRSGTGDEPRHVVTVTLRPNDSSTIRDSCENLGLSSKTDIPDVGKIRVEIEEEYARVKDILHRGGLKIVYQ